MPQLARTLKENFKQQLISRTMHLVKRSLIASNQDQCIAAINWHFQDSSDPPDETPLEMCGICSRTCEILSNAGICSVEQLCEMTRDEVREISSVGAVALREIVAKLASKGIGLRKAETSGVYKGKHSANRIA